MPNDFKQTKLYKTAFAARENDAFAAERLTLVAALDQMRGKVEKIVAEINATCPGLTVHDITHLDALWITADKLVSDDLHFSPIETFVFGAAVLLHDAGMALSAYPGGMDEIKQTVTWRDHVAVVSKSSGLTPEKDFPFEEPPEDIMLKARFATLRDLHADQASILAKRNWTIKGQQHQLIENVDLRNALATRIGQIANSHHWDVEDLEKLTTSGGIPAGFPPDWTFNPIKVACLLRCADISHIDSLRAPEFQYALVRPVGVSELHWNFQNRLNQPEIRDGYLVYSSNRPFEPVDADAWWLAYDTINAIDKEIARSSDLLTASALPPLAVRGVQGANNPTTLAKHINTSGWMPVDASVRVSDPISLAATLGGANLYGDRPSAALRELLQNSVDAVRARRVVDPSFTASELIEVRLERHEDKYVLTVTDTGVGMPQRILTGNLIDFGKSIASENLLLKEFPGLESQRPKRIAKFGIGFFSIFILGSEVSVASRKYLDGLDNTNVLEFRGLSSRPLVRKAAAIDLPSWASTRVSVVLNDRWTTSEGHRLNWSLQVSRILRSLIAPLDVRVRFIDADNAQTEHLGAWENEAPENFLEELLSAAPIVDDKEHFLALHARLLRTIKDANGTTLGRAALLIREGDWRNTSLGFVSVGGIASQSDNSRIQYVGVMNGEATNAARTAFELAVPSEAIANWATDQAVLIADGPFSSYSKLESAKLIFQWGGDPSPLPVCFAGGRLIDFEAFKNTLTQERSFLIGAQPPRESSDDDSFRLTRLDDLRVPDFTDHIARNFFVFAGLGYRDHGVRLESETAEEEYEVSLDSLRSARLSDPFLNALIESAMSRWADTLRVRYLHAPVSNSEFRKRWCLRLDGRD